MPHGKTGAKMQKQERVYTTLMGVSAESSGKRDFLCLSSRSRRSTACNLCSNGGAHTRAERLPSGISGGLIFLLTFRKVRQMRTDVLQNVLEELKSSSADVEASALISSDGLMIASALQQGVDEDRVGAMSAALLSLGDRAARELARGTLESVQLKGERGYVMMVAAGREAVLTVLAKPSAKLGLLLLDVKRASEALSKLV